MFSETAIIVEIWQDHAALQTTRFIAPGSAITIDGEPGHVNGEVATCTRDGDHGYLTEVECPGLYSAPGRVGPWLMPEQSSSATVARPS
jgi:hypothetical protein